MVNVSALITQRVWTVNDVNHSTMICPGDLPWVERRMLVKVRNKVYVTWPSLLVLLPWYPLMIVKSLQLIWRLGTCRCDLRVPNLQMSCSDLTVTHLKIRYSCFNKSQWFDLIGNNDIIPLNGHCSVYVPFCMDAHWLLWIDLVKCLWKYRICVLEKFVTTSFSQEIGVIKCPWVAGYQSSPPERSSCVARTIHQS